jgi:alpha-beta hydrolase superfamily lysophospholipase
MLAADIARRVYRRTQIFCPAREPLKSWNPTDYGIPEGAVEEHWIETPDGELLHAWYCRAEQPVASGVFCHGNTGNLTISADVIPHLLNAGFNVLFYDTIRPPSLPSVLSGVSLGGAIAAQVIRRHPFDGLILQSTFTSLPSITRVLYPKLPLHLLAGDLFNTLSVIRNLQVPLLVLHGTEDEVCPCSMAHEIFDACKAPKRIHRIEGGLHKDLFTRDPDTLVWAISQFVAELPKNHHADSVEGSPKLEQLAATVLRMLRRAIRRRSGVIASAAR